MIFRRRICTSPYCCFDLIQCQICQPVSMRSVGQSLIRSQCNRILAIRQSWRPPISRCRSRGNRGLSHQFCSLLLSKKRLIKTRPRAGLETSGHHSIIQQCCSSRLSSGDMVPQRILPGLSNSPGASSRRQKYSVSGPRQVSPWYREYAFRSFIHFA